MMFKSVRMAALLSIVATSPAMAGGIAALSTGGNNITSSATWFGMGIASGVAGYAARPWVATATITISGMTCYAPTAPGAGVTIKIVPSVVTAGTVTVTDKVQEADLIGTSLTFTYPVTTTFTMNAGDGLAAHSTVTGGSIANTPVSCSFDWQ